VLCTLYTVQYWSPLDRRLNGIIISTSSTERYDSLLRRLHRATGTVIDDFIKHTVRCLQIDVTMTKFRCHLIGSKYCRTVVHHVFVCFRMQDDSMTYDIHLYPPVPGTEYSSTTRYSLCPIMIAPPRTLLRTYSGILPNVMVFL
jgi:hypothetical protein